MAKKKSKSKGPRQAAGGAPGAAGGKQVAPSPRKPASGPSPLAIAGVVGLIALGLWLWSGARGAQTHAGSADAAPFDERLRDPSALTERAPDTFAVQLDTTSGAIVIDVHRSWSPNGADRFYNLVRAGYFTDVAFFRVIDGFMAQCGIHGNPEVNRIWRDAIIADDPVVEHNTRGFVSFATGGPNTRTTQFFINFGDNSRLDASGFSPFGRVRDMRNVDRLDSRYGEGAPEGRGPEQSRIQTEGNAYLRADFPGLDYIRSARVLD